MVSNGLPSPAQPWARTVESRLADLERSLPQISATDQNQTRTLQAVQQAIQAIQTQQGELEDQQGQLSTLIANRLATDYGFAQAGAVSIPTANTYTNIISTVTTPPTWANTAITFSTATFDLYTEHTTNPGPSPVSNGTAKLGFSPAEIPTICYTYGATLPRYFQSQLCSLSFVASSHILVPGTPITTWLMGQFFSGINAKAASGTTLSTVSLFLP